MRNNMDERQQAVQGKIMRNALIALLSVILTLGFLECFEVFSILNYMNFSEFCINLVSLIVAYISVNLIIKDAYFGMFSEFQKKFSRIVFTLLSILMDILIVFDLIRGDGFSPISLPSIIMSNSIALSLWWKYIKKE